MQTTARRLALEWARASAPVVESDLLSSLDRADERHVNCTLAISRELTKSNTPFLLSYYGGEIFVFELTQRQAKSFQAINRMMQCVEGSSNAQLPAAAPMFDLSGLEIEDADGLAGEEPIRGAVYYERQSDVHFPGEVCLSMEFALHHHCRKTMYYYPHHALLPEGELQFTFPPAAKQENERLVGGFTGPIVVHVRLIGAVNPQSPEGRVPLSNAAAAVIELI